MINKKSVSKSRNWVLVFVSTILIILGLTLVILAVMSAGSLGWWSLLIGVSGLTTVAAAVMSIVKNDPAWILLDLIIPG